MPAARYVGHANFHLIAHAIRNPVELMGAMASMTTGGVLGRHLKLRCASGKGRPNADSREETTKYSGPSC